MIKKGIIQGVIAEREYTSRDGGKYINQSLLIRLPFVTVSGKPSYDEIIADRSCAQDEREAVKTHFGQERELTLFFSTRQWTNPNTNEVKWFQECRLSRIAIVE